MNLKIKDACKEIHDNSVAHGFWELENVPEKLLLAICELAEATEAHRKGGNLDAMIDTFLESDRSDLNFEKYIKDSFGDELADAVIRIFDLAEHMNIPLEFHIKIKHSYNLNRPYKHNKQY